MQESKNDPDGPTPTALLADENRGFGGAERHLITLATELNSRGVLRAVLGRRDSWLATNIGSLPFHPVGFRNEIDMLSVFNIYRKLSSSKANILHCIGHRDLVASALALQLPGAPKGVLVKAEHSYPDDRLSPLFRWAYSQCQAIVSVSKALDNKIQGALSLKDSVRFLVIPNGIPIPTKIPTPSPRREGRLHLGVLSPLRPGKGHTDFLQALSCLKEVNIRATIAGDGPEEKNLREQAAQQNVEVEFLGHLEQPQKYLQSLDLCVVPSHSETFSLVTLEAMVHGLPIIAADSEGVQEISCDYPATLYPVGDVKALKEALLTFCSDPVPFAERSQNAAAAARETFSSQRMADSYDHLYRELLKRS